MAATTDATPAPSAFRRAVGDLTSAPWRPELRIEQIPAPQRIAPFAAAVTADVLAGHEAQYLAPSGTVTAVSSESFGGMAEEPPRAEVEVRASWTPLLEDGIGLLPHLAAWAELLCTTAGLPPLPAGVVMMPPRRNPPSRSSRRR